MNIIYKLFMSAHYLLLCHSEKKENHKPEKINISCDSHRKRVFIAHGQGWFLCAQAQTPVDVLFLSQTTDETGCPQAWEKKATESPSLVSNKQRHEYSGRGHQAFPSGEPTLRVRQTFACSRASWPPHAPQ